LFNRGYIVIKLSIFLIKRKELMGGQVNRNLQLHN
jgi:hypothetical protein